MSKAKRATIYLADAEPLLYFFRRRSIGRGGGSLSVW